MWRSPASIIAGRGLVPPDVCPCWLPTWLPEISLAPPTFHDRTCPGSGRNKIATVRAPALEAVMQPAAGLYGVEVEPEVRSWLENLTDRDFGRVAFLVGLLAEHAADLGEPYTRHLG